MWHDRRRDLPSPFLTSGGPLAVAVLQRSQLEQSPLADLHALATEVGVEGFRRMRREELIEKLSGESGTSGAPDGDAADSGAARPARRSRRPRERRPGGRQGAGAERGGDGEARGSARPSATRAAVEPEPVAEEEPTGDEEVRSGVLDILPNGSGFMRADPFRQAAEDVYVAPAQIRRCELRSGDELAGPVRPPRRSERHPSLVRVDLVNDAPAEPPPERPLFEDLTPVFAAERLTGPEGLESVLIGRGSRVAVGGPAGTGATTLLRRIVSTLAEHHPELSVVVVLAGVRPEEVTEWRREAAGASVAGGSFDGPPDERARTAEVALGRARRLAERGGHAVLVVDGLDTLPQGLARQLFGAARNTEEGGSVTVIASAVGAEMERYATTHIVLEPSAGEGARFAVSAVSGTLRPHLLTG